MSISAFLYPPLPACLPACLCLPITVAALKLKSQCSFCQYYSTQHCLLVLIEKWKEVLDTEIFMASFQQTYDKPFDCLEHDFLTAIEKT